MLSVESIVIGVLAIGILVTGTVASWRFTSILARMSEYGARFSERNESQRDRYMERYIENVSMTKENAQAKLALAQLHATESRDGQRLQVGRDRDADEKRKSAIAAEAELKLRNRAVLGGATNNPKDTYT